MPGRVDILDQPEALGKPLAGSVLLHVALFGSLAAWHMATSRGGERFGNPNSLGGGGVMITAVSRIPLPATGGIVNPVANDTDSQVPAPPPKSKAAEKTREPDPDAIALKSRKQNRRTSDIAASRQRYRNPNQDRPSQLYSSTGQALASPMYGSTGGGGVGIGGGGAFGTRFGWYEQLLRERVAKAWQPPVMDPRLQTVVITFDIHRDGSVRNVMVLQRSGNVLFDNSCQRAVLEASPFPQLPAGYERDSARIEFWFQPRR